MDRPLLLLLALGVVVLLYVAVVDVYEQSQPSTQPPTRPIGQSTQPHHQDPKRMMMRRRTLVGLHPMVSQ